MCRDHALFTDSDNEEDDEIGRVRQSVNLSLLLNRLTSDLYFSACARDVTIARREWKIKVIGQGQGVGLGLARMVTRSVCRRSPIDDAGQLF